LADGIHCPSCGKDIGFMALVKAPWTSRITCPHCRAKLKYLDVRNFNIVLVVTSIIIGFPAGWFFVNFIYDGEVYLSSLILLAVIFIWLPIELALGRYLRAHKQLARRE
jgi:uncharacterized paraquat-inducible protein A